MPRATVDIGVTEKCDLKTCPPDGFVELRKLSFGEILQRRQLVTEISVQGRSRNDTKTTVDMLIEETAFFDFKNCIVNHNLEDESGNPLDFRSKICVQKLDPKIGEEINTLIDKMNNFNPDEESDSGNSPNGLKPVSS